MTLSDKIEDGGMRPWLEAKDVKEFIEICDDDGEDEIDLVCDKTEGYEEYERGFRQGIRAMQKINKKRAGDKLCH
jgi:hypothetical protein